MHGVGVQEEWEMRIGLVDGDKTKFPNLPLMKLSAWHKKQGDIVEFALPIMHYDKVYISKIFGDEYSKFQDVFYNADEIVYGGTGFAITIEGGKEVYHKDRDKDLPYEVEHIYPDYGLYPELTEDTAFGFLTRGCCNNCSFCIVSKKEGVCSKKVANLSEFWRGQKNIKLLDANILACKDRMELLYQLRDSNAAVDFTQGLDARFLTREVCEALRDIKKSNVHFAFDFMKNESKIIKGLKMYKDIVGVNDHTQCYVLTNYDTNIKEDWYRVNALRNIGIIPYVMIYRKTTAPKVLRDLQRWCNNRILYRSCDFLDYIPRKGGGKIADIYGDGCIEY